MEHVGRIVVGLDSDERSDAGLRWALALAARHGSVVEVVHAWQEPVAYGYPGAGPWLLLDAATEQRAADLVAAAIGRVRAGTDLAEAQVVARPVRGFAPQVLEGAARSADLVVVTRRHDSRLSRALGSTTGGLLHHSAAAVAVVPHNCAAPGSPPSSVVVGTDHEAHSRSAVAWAAARAGETGALLRPVLVRPSGPASDAGGYDQGDAERQTEHGLALEVSEVAPDVRVQVRPELGVGRPGPALVERAGATDLLVVGSRRRSALAGWLLGSTSSYAAHHASCPVVVTR